MRATDLTSKDGKVPRKTVYSTGDAAKVFRCSVGMICKWLDYGELLAYRLPGSRDRHIPHECLMAFAEKHGLTQFLWLEMEQQ